MTELEPLTKRQLAQVRKLARYTLEALFAVEALKGQLPPLSRRGERILREGREGLEFLLASTDGVLRRHGEKLT